VIAAVGATIGSRVVLAFVAARDRAGRTTFVLSGMRGALPLALALALPQHLPHRTEIIDGVFAVVLVTLVVQGAPLEAVVRRFYGPLTDRS
jgi:NhaP-type Na+/H+ or K+/H+ antiporter